MTEREYFGHVIDGKEVDSLDGARFETVNPWTREVVGRRRARRPSRTPSAAVAAARRAFDEGPWPRMGYAERQRLLHRLADLMEANADELAIADTPGHGQAAGRSATTTSPGPR